MTMSSRSALTLGLAISVVLLLATASSGGTGGRSLSVPATTPFLDTGVTLAKNQHATLAAHGVISYGSQNPACGGSRITPNGCAAERICPVPVGCGALVGRVGNGKAFVVGAGRVVDGPGAIWLGINDKPGAFADNSGAFHVTITVGPGAEVAKVLRIFSGHLYVRRSGSSHVSALAVGDLLDVGDEILTSQNGTAALEFVIGGRVQVGPGATVTVTGERSINGGAQEDTSLKLGTGSGTGTVQIQTNGGVLGGIKG